MCCRCKVLLTLTDASSASSHQHRATEDSMMCWSISRHSCDAEDSNKTCQSRLKLHQEPVTSDNVVHSMQRNILCCYTRTHLSELISDLLLPVLHLHASLIQLLPTPCGTRSNTGRALTVNLLLLLLALQAGQVRGCGGPLALSKLQPLLGTLHSFSVHVEGCSLRCINSYMYVLANADTHASV